MIEPLIEKLMKAETNNQILSYKPQILELYNDLYEKIRSRGCSILNYEDIKMLHNLSSYMQAYYGTLFYEKGGIPFLRANNPRTIDILEFVVLFYSLQVINLLESGFYNEASKCIYKHPTDLVFERTEKINLADNQHSLFAVLWLYFVQVITIKDNTSEFTMEYNGEQVIFYLTDEKYEKVLDIIYESINNDNCFCVVIESILGRYRTRLTKIEYISKYQPLFVNVGYDYLCALMRQGSCE